MKAVDSTRVEMVEFLRERLDEEERQVNAIDLLTSMWDNEDEGFISYNIPELSEYVITYQPKRTRQEIAFKRSLLDRFEIQDMKNMKGQVIRRRTTNFREEYLLLGMVAVYSDHPEFKLEWTHQ